MENWQRQLRENLEKQASRLDSDIEESKLRLRHLKAKRKNVAKILEEMIDEAQTDAFRAQEDVQPDSGQNPPVQPKPKANARRNTTVKK